ncbi:PAF acetylhydrolase family protein [Cordyceps javanica]|uniref:1-alkyl-2-acetylglycerophosphocholine esterase n=1 Tax=Cordyceps javanica TaxID=43265 RepID=A0A545V5P7_9HYPO|nr:PAF acetylhydrolase family protein [Cordyceps javanica]TQW08297.1 PAF acetylhydrolase family protein [Cordyceps javanica]
MKSSLPFFALAAAAAATIVPGPSGPYAVGYSTVVLTDGSRQDPFAPTPQKRRVPVSAYLPVDVSNKACPKQKLPYMTPAVAAHYDQGAAQLGLANDTFAKLDMEYCDLRKLCSKKTRGNFPLVLYDTGVGPSRSLYGVKARNLASQGYIVVTVDHPYDADIVEFPDGSIVEATAFNGTEAEVVHFLKVRGQDLSFVLAQLQTGSVRRSLLAHYPSAIDFARTASVGHSLGGVASELVANSEHLVRGAVNMDGGVREPVLSAGSDKPTMQFGRAGHGDADPSWDAFWPRLRGPAAELALANATHGTFTDALTLAAPFLGGLPPQVVKALQEELGSIDAEDAEKSILGALVAGLEFVFEGRSDGIDKIHQNYPSLAVVRSHS